ncbi:hypothetical protein G6F57_008609 [Rhizopus arrhizus]|uniref:Myb-like domain-containing protein n=1 Tax=Rhizopus oryzae TaxID=64495 RepID=A0A9P6X6V5_RHIOR|nr:hypothetical protein G6F23_006971 [Rhizopus arrhizus]KAG1414079.1 hypothetical protein G6F58_007141 [Rhizopus delemar]KAG0760716.1 hypothetical protein G6F24_008108 [Rhizopus arrhizus]KAG0787472.1 hypothetical protein G6F21_007883 [Rhizopus arrhizus]KAG0808999.1 hypothetical protein G6F20_009121 [Rhizopus arrhizus]
MTDNLQEAEQEAKRWMIIGAHQAGATERKIARISGLSTTAVRHILLNYQQNGTPSIPKQVPKRVREKPIVEYDEDGNIIDSESEEEQEQIQQTRKKAKNNNSNNNDEQSSSSSDETQTQTKKSSKMDQTIRGYEIWTHEDDMILLDYVLHHLYTGGWHELESKYNGRHSARLCHERWKYLKSLLIHGITDKPNTPW